MNQGQPSRKLSYVRDAAFAIALAGALGGVLLFDQQIPARITNSSNSSLDSKPTSILDASSDGRLNSQSASEYESLSGNTPAVTQKLPVDSTMSLESKVADHSKAESQTSSKTTRQPTLPMARLVVDVDSLRQQQRLREARNKAELDLPAKVEFFSTKAEAESVVFVVDCSGSMAGSRIQRTRAELIQSILNLSRRQIFFVCFFNNGPIAMFQQSGGGLLAFLGGAAARGTALTSQVEASAVMKLGVCKWISSIPPGGGTNPEPSLVLAAKMKPDVIYLLSDGIFDPLKASTFNMLESRGIVVHTLAFEDKSGAVLLKSIADRTSGTYQFIPAGGPVPDVELTFTTQLTRELIDELTDDDDDVRQRARGGLVEMSGGTDFGPQQGATPGEVATSVKRWIRWWAEDVLAKELLHGSVDQLLAELTSFDAVRRLSAVLACGQGKLDVPERLIPMLHDSESLVREAARDVLVRLADGRNYGPTDTSNDAEVTQAILHWSMWTDHRQLLPELSKLPMERLKQAIKSPEIARRWAAASVLGQQAMRGGSPDAAAVVLIDALNDMDANVLQEVRRVLVNLAEGDDYGPREGATDDERAKAIREWTQWRLKMLDMRASGKFRQAKNLYDIGKTKAARDWMSEIARDFSGTNTAKKAQAFIELIDKKP